VAAFLTGRELLAHAGIDGLLGALEAFKIVAV
jgi:hypothetical protein